MPKNAQTTSQLHSSQMATHSSVLAWRIPGTGEPSGLLSYGVAQSRTRLSDLTFFSFLLKLLLFSHWVQLSVNPWTVAHQAPLSSTISWSLLKFMSIESVFKLVLEKAEEPEIKLPTSAVSSKKQERSRKTSIFALLTMPKPLTVWFTINWGKF